MVSRTEWADYTGGGIGLNSGSDVALFDGAPGGSGTLYTSQPHTAGETNLKDGLSKKFAPVDADNLDVCYLPGTRIATPAGEKLVEDLRPGDWVSTLDAGPQPVLWTDRRQVTSQRMDLCPDLRPIKIARGALGGGLPRRPVFISPQHRVMVHDRSGREMLAKALHLAQSALPRCRIIRRPAPFELIHFALPDHHIVIAEGSPMESFFTGPMALRALSPSARTRLMTAFPTLRNGRNPMKMARPCLKRREVLALFANAQAMRA